MTAPQIRLAALRRLALAPDCAGSFSGLVEDLFPHGTLDAALARVHLHDALRLLVVENLVARIPASRSDVERWQITDAGLRVAALHAACAAEQPAPQS